MFTSCAIVSSRRNYYAPNAGTQSSIFTRAGGIARLPRPLLSFALHFVPSIQGLVHATLVVREPVFIEVSR